MTGSRTIAALAVAAGVAAACTGCAIGEDAVTNGKSARHAPKPGPQPGFLGDRASMLAYLMEHLDVDPAGCENRTKLHIRCTFTQKTDGYRDGKSYVDVKVSTSGMLMTTTGPGIDKLIHHYDNR
jgi:hypothetical protein